MLKVFHVAKIVSRRNNKIMKISTKVATVGLAVGGVSYGAYYFMCPHSNYYK